MSAPALHAARARRPDATRSANRVTTGQPPLAAPQPESKRAVLTSYVLAIAAAVSGLVARQGCKLRTLPLPVLVIVIGRHGALAVAKYHERAGYRLVQARALTRALTESSAVADRHAALEEFCQAHYQDYPGCTGSGCTSCGPGCTSASPPAVSCWSSSPSRSGSSYRPVRDGGAE